MVTKAKAPANGKTNPVIHSTPKLDIACGQNKQVGFKGIDIAGNPDIVHDLNEFPWPIKTSCVKQVFCSHYVEHIPHWRPGWERDGWWMFFDELYRVMKPDATAEIIHPYAMNGRAFQDPTHTRYITDATWAYLNREWRELNRLDHYNVECNFEIVTISMMGLSDGYLARNPEMQEFSRAHYWNVVQDLGILLKAIK